MLKKCAAVFLAVLIPANLFAYPTSVKKTLSLNISQATGGFAISDNDRSLYVAYTETARIIDLATMTLTSTQLQLLSEDDGTDGNFKGIAFYPTLNRLYGAQDDGDILYYNLSNLSAKPVSTTIASGKNLEPFAIDADSGILYAGSESEKKIYVIDTGSSGVSGSIDLSQGGSTTSTFNILDMIFVPEINELYIATDIGIIFYVPSGGLNATPITIDAEKNAEFAALAATPIGDKVYAVVSNSNFNRIESISTSSHLRGAPIEIDTQDNSGLTDIAVMDVLSPNGAIYGFVSGQKGISVFDTSNNTLIDLNENNDADGKKYDPISTTYYGQLIASSNNYLYMSSGGGEISVITERPYLDVSSVSYVDSSGTATTALKQGGTVSITFQSDTDGTYTVRSGGDINQSGHLLTDTSGATSGSATAATPVTTSFAYDTNSGYFDEGANTVFIFLTDSESVLGRIATTVTVDTPPSAVEIKSTGFGNERAYITFSRLTASDVSYYNLYADIDEAVVQAKTTVSGTVSQTSGGDDVIGMIGGLTNGTTYYLAVEGVDTNGNIGPRTYLKTDGSAASAVPQETAGPAGLSGETGGCSLVSKNNAGCESFGLLFAFIVFVIARIRYGPRRRGIRHGPRRSNLRQTNCICGIVSSTPRQTRGGLAMTSQFIILLIILSSSSVFAEEAEKEVQRSPQNWSVELKSGFWMPTDNVTENFFDKCCNIVTGINGGWLYQGRYGVEGGVGVFIKDARALGATTGDVSEDSFNLFLLPMETNAVWRIDYAPNQFCVPYLKGGVAYVFYREGDRGRSIKGLKTGLQFTGGLQFLIKNLDSDAAMEMDYGINDIYFTIEARYNWINSFGKKGLDLSGPIYSAGLLFEF